jgi:sugar lactone lactonase YvrE
MKKTILRTVAPLFLAALVCLAVVSGSAYAQIKLPSVGLINTVAGDGLGGYSGDGGLATSAELYVPVGVTVDTAGNIYIADENNNRIRKVTASTGLISTVAGDGIEGYSGDGGAATSAKLYYPTGVTLDTGGNIYIADYFNYRIRKVTASTGLISTVAGDGIEGYSGDGGAATSAKLGYPTGVAVDVAGNIYIADYDNYRIRKVTASTGIISTVAGDGTEGYSGDGGAATSAELGLPYGVAVDTAGNIYIADTGNSRIRKVTASTGIISTVAGDGTAGYSGDAGTATSAELDNPTGVALDTAGNIYIADEDNQRIRKVTVSTGIISTVSGDGTEGYSDDGGAATSAELASPIGVAVDKAGNIYISTIGYNFRIRAVGGAGFSGFINPKYVVVGVVYAPPGSSSSVTYTNTTSVGDTTTIASSFTSDVGYSVSEAIGIGIPAGGITKGGVNLTFTESTDYTQGSNSSQTLTISKASTIAYTTGGTPTFAPVNSDYDYIWLWLNPEFLVSYTPAAGSNPANLQLTGYAFDPTDPASGEPPASGPYISGPDIVEVQVGCLDGDFSCPSTLTITDGVVTSGTLARSWAAGEYQWAAGQGPGLTTADIAYILTFDPLVPSNDYTLLESFPSTTSDGRFTKEPYPPNPIQYPVGAATEMYNTVQTDTESVASGASTMIKQAFGVSEQFGTSFLDIFTSTTTMTESLTLTWNYTWLNTLTTTTTLTDALSVKGPPDPPPTYDGPVEFIAYQDNIFGTFAFVPVNP